MNCSVCAHHCVLNEGQVGLCKARMMKDGKIVCRNYGLITSSGLDPIEKKPLREFHPGSLILSVGSFGCNLRCPFCQNYQISQTSLVDESDYVSPETLVDEAVKLIPEGNLGIAFTYNEPLVGFEYVRDTAKLAKAKGLATVLVTNGCFSLTTLEAVLPYMDAMNIDLKGFSQGFFDYVGDDFEMTKAFIVAASSRCHVELTTLIVPAHNDSPESMEEEAKWIASISPRIPLHITRYFPRYHEKAPATSIPLIHQLSAIARRYLTSVYEGNL